MLLRGFLAVAAACNAWERMCHQQMAEITTSPKLQLFLQCHSWKLLLPDVLKPCWGHIPIIAFAPHASLFITALLARGRDVGLHTRQGALSWFLFWFPPFRPAALLLGPLPLPCRAYTTGNLFNKLVQFQMGSFSSKALSMMPHRRERANNVWGHVSYALSSILIQAGMDIPNGQKTGCNHHIGVT